MTLRASENILPVIVKHGYKGKVIAVPVLG
jgi:hypothetical protein